MVENRGIGSWPERWARLAPDKVALVQGERRVTYRELAERVRRLANGLRLVGIGRGDRVAWLGPNHIAFLESLFAVSSLGAIFVPISHRHPERRVQKMMHGADVSAIVQHPSVGVRAPPAVRHILVPPDGESPTGPVATAGIRYEALIASASNQPISQSVSLDDICMMPHTSGTTGSSKGVMLTHRNMTWNSMNMVTSVDILHDDVSLALAPMFRAGGTGVNVLPLMLKGGTVIVPSGDVSADEVLRLMEQHRVTIGFGNPGIVLQMTQSPRWASVDLSSLRFVLTGGGTVPERLIHQYFERGVPLVQGYGQTEVTAVALLLDATQGLTKAGAAGRAPPLLDVRVRRSDGSEAAPGEIGELEVRGPNVMLGYWNREDATRKALGEDGWLRTGDVVRMDDDGDIWIIDRAGQSFTTHGVELYPGEVERVLMRHEGVSEAGVVGYPLDGHDGLVPVAFVVRSSDELSGGELAAYWQYNLPNHAWPAALYFVHELPKNSVGKLLRSSLSGYLDAWSAG
jgi:fatty-acyl-CoA synthase